MPPNPTLEALRARHEPHRSPAERVQAYRAGLEEQKKHRVRTALAGAGLGALFGGAIGGSPMRAFTDSKARAYFAAVQPHLTRGDYQALESIGYLPRGFVEEISKGRRLADALTPAVSLAASEAANARLGQEFQGAVTRLMAETGLDLQQASELVAQQTRARVEQELAEAGPKAVTSLHKLLDAPNAAVPPRLQLEGGAPLHPVRKALNYYLLSPEVHTAQKWAPGTQAVKMGLPAETAYNPALMAWLKKRIGLHYMRYLPHVAGAAVLAAISQRKFRDLKKSDKEVQDKLEAEDVQRYMMADAAKPALAVLGFQRGSAMTAGTLADYKDVLTRAART